MSPIRPQDQGLMDEHVAIQLFGSARLKRLAQRLRVAAELEGIGPISLVERLVREYLDRKGL